MRRLTSFEESLVQSSLRWIRDDEWEDKYAGLADEFTHYFADPMRPEQIGEAVSLIVQFIPMNDIQIYVETIQARFGKEIKTGVHDRLTSQMKNVFSVIEKKQ